MVSAKQNIAYKTDSSFKKREAYKASKKAVVL